MEGRPFQAEGTAQAKAQRQKVKGCVMGRVDTCECLGETAENDPASVACRGGEDEGLEELSPSSRGSQHAAL